MTEPLIGAANQPHSTAVDDTIEQLARAISHDLREPLIIVQQFAELLRAEYGDRLDEQGCEWLERIERNSRRAQQMVQTLRQFWTLGVDPARWTQVDLNQLLEFARGELQDEVSFTFRIESERLPTVLGDPHLLKRILVEVVRNAMQHGRQEGLILTACNVSDADGQGIALVDNGSGIPAALLPQVTTLFVSSNAAHHVGGGLSIAQRIMQLHGGQLHVTSCNQGTRVRLLWPSGSDTESTLIDRDH